jgi:hexosaminidase
MKTFFIGLFLGFLSLAQAQQSLVDLSRGLDLSAQRSKTERLSTFVDALQYCIPINDKSQIKLQVVFESSPKSLDGIDESFELRIDQDSIIVSAQTDVGAGYGLMHLIELSSKGKEFTAPCGVYKSTPRYSWRGLMIDVSRHYIAPQIIERNMRTMAFAKLNVLHLHLSDDQSFRMESEHYKKLQTEGCEGGHYSQAVLQGLVELGNEYGIQVIPEIDVPGHASSICAAYPHLCSKHMHYEVEHGYGIFDASLDPSNDSVYLFIDDIANEVNSIFNGTYMHIGGDENKGVHWIQNDLIQGFMKDKKLRTAEELQAYFNQRVYKILDENNLKMIGWDEIMNKDLPRDIIIQSWRGKESVMKADSMGFNAILSKGFYLDKCFSAYKYYQNELPQTNNMLGGEACMWTELVYERTLESRLWPASLAIGKKLWDGKEVFSDEEAFNSWLNSGQEKISSLGLPLQADRKVILKELAPKYTADMTDFISLFSPKTGYQRHFVYKNQGTYNDMIDLRTFADVLRADETFGNDLRFYHEKQNLSPIERDKFNQLLDRAIDAVEIVKGEVVFEELSDAYLESILEGLRAERSGDRIIDGERYSGFEVDLGFYFTLQ